MCINDNEKIANKKKKREKLVGNIQISRKMLLWESSQITDYKKRGKKYFDTMKDS